VGSDLTGTAANNINVEDGSVRINRLSSGTTIGNCKYDEIVVASRVLSATEIDQVRGGNFGAVASTHALFLGSNF
jgi:hypothetical protein